MRDVEGLRERPRACGDGTGDEQWTMEDEGRQDRERCEWMSAVGDGDLCPKLLAFTLLT